MMRSALWLLVEDQMLCMFKSLTIWNAISCYSKWCWVMVGFSDFQRNYRFGLNLADRDVDLIERNKFVGVLSFVFPRL